MNKISEMKQWFKSNKKKIAIVTGGIITTVVIYKMTGSYKKSTKIQDNISKGIELCDNKVFDITVEITKDEAIQILESGKKFSIEQINDSISMIWIDKDIQEVI